MVAAEIGVVGLTGQTRVRSKWASPSPAALRLILAFGFAVALAAPGSAQAVLDILVNETGNISLSADGAGSTGDSATIQVEKPNAAATVRSAFLSCAATGARVIGDDEVSLNGNPVSFSVSAANSTGEIFFHNVFGEVTAIVKPTVDAALPGLVDFTQSEALTSTGFIEGCALYVIFDDPGATDGTIFILFGSQTTTGDSFNVTLAEPLDTANDTADFGLAISFSFQGSKMVSSIDINGTRLTSSAGGHDDGGDSNGALVTVGGIGDTNDNPAPFDAPNGPRFDDELYSLLPLLGPGDTSIRIDTINPSDDDNIFAGHMVFSGMAIEGEGIVLPPTEASNSVGTSHTITASVVGDSGDPVADRLVGFNVIAGPSCGASSDPGQGECAPNNDCTTDASGRVSWTYTKNGSTGRDAITAKFTTSQGLPARSSRATRSWLSGFGATLLVDPLHAPDDLITELNNALLAPSGGVSITPDTEVFVGRVGDGEGCNTAQSATYADFNLVSGLNVPSSNLVLPNGILLTSGNANISNMNTSEDFQEVTGTGSDTDAAAILAAAGLQSTVADVNSYSFEFTVSDGNDAVAANFVFGSEEFPTQPYNDFFLFIVDGANYATFEDGNLVVFDDGGNETNFNDNDFHNPTPNYPIEYDGLSNVLVAIGKLTPNLSTHTLKIIVGDTSDSKKGADPNLDSAVFIGGLRACELGKTCPSGPRVCKPDVVCDTDLPGVCSAGSTSCDEQGRLTCVAQTLPGELVEVCDSLDNDCDAAVDEGLDQTTTCGIGECASAGVIA
ncbi:MAG: choice-of-anchor L domain-containing protein, partial [Myxococcota bacterium]